MSYLWVKDGEDIWKVAAQFPLPDLRANARAFSQLVHVRPSRRPEASQAEGAGSAHSADAERGCIGGCTVTAVVP